MLTQSFRPDARRGRGILLLAISSLVAALAGIDRLNGEAAEDDLANGDTGVPVEIATANRSDLIRSIAARCAVIGVSRAGGVRLVAEIPACQTGRITRGAEAELTFPSIPGESWRGEISHRDAAADGGPEGVVLTITLSRDASPQAEVTRGMTGKIVVRTETAVALLVVPRGAVLRREGRTSVFLCRDGRVVMVPVSTGLSNETFAEILSGLREGDTVVTASRRPVADGSKIRIVDEKTGASIVVRTGHAQRKRDPSPLEAEAKPDFISSLFLKGY